ncbi:MAG TPA: hypothetical protein VHX16_04210 [Chloroflexota bacterium]|nr:hypothetical protein [Chloroflexota bacterium]
MKPEVYFCPRCQEVRQESQTMMFTVFGPWRRRCTRCGSSVTATGSDKLVRA